MSPLQRLYRRAGLFSLAIACAAAMPARARASSCADDNAAPTCIYSPQARRAAQAAQASRPGTPPGPAALLCASCPASWVARAPIPPRSLANVGLEGSSVGILGDKMYVSHGYAQSVDEAELRIYDIPSDTWTFGNPAFLARSEGGGAIANGKFYSISGRTTPMIEEYDPATTAWTIRAFAPSFRKGMAVGVINDQIHVVGGSDGYGPHNGINTVAHEVYDPPTDTWTTAAPLPVALGDIYASVVHGGKMYVFGGWSGTTVVASTYIYDPVANSWSTGAPVPTARSNAIAGELCGLLWVIGGIDNAMVNMTVVEAYDPVTDTWCTGPSKPTPLAEGGSSGITRPGAIHAVGGGHSGASVTAHEVLELASCSAVALERIVRLQGVKRTPGAEFSWQPDPNAPNYHLNTVTVKTAIGDPASKLPPAGVAVNQCDVTTPTCTDADAITDPARLLFYQALSACGPTSADEGPV